MKRYTLTVEIDFGEHETCESPRDRARELVYRLPWSLLTEVHLRDSDGTNVPLAIDKASSKGGRR